MYKQIFLSLSLLLAGCSSMPSKPITTVDYVDLERFMGDWYVIANIPTYIEKDAYNAIESYALNDAGDIDTTFSFNKGSFDGERKVYTPKGFIYDKKSNAVWGMQFIWPFKADYRIVYLDDKYSVTIIGRNKRDYVWVMARDPKIEDVTYIKLLGLLKKEGYDISQVQKVPQKW